MLANTARGDDAAGAAAIKHGGGCLIYKRATDAYALIEHEDLRRVTRLREAEVLIAHTRLATHGANTDRNAHPFRERNLTGAHNGIIYNHMELGSLIEQDGWKKRAEVDSQQIFRVLSAAGPVTENAGLGKAYADLLPLATGMMALTWTDDRDPGRVYWYRDSSPLSVAVVPSAHTAYWSSQSDHLAAALQSTYGGDWYMSDIKPDILYRAYWDAEKDDLMIQKFPVDVPPQLKASITTRSAALGPPSADAYWEERIAAETHKPVVWIDECNICMREIKLDDSGTDLEGVWQSDGYMLCNACNEWWTGEGLETYHDLETFIEIQDTNGINLRQGVPITQKEVETW